jgi:hypothetical protein
MPTVIRRRKRCVGCRFHPSLDLPHDLGVGLEAADEADASTGEKSDLGNAGRPSIKGDGLHHVGIRRGP